MAKINLLDKLEKPKLSETSIRWNLANNPPVYQHGPARKRDQPLNPMDTNSSVLALSDLECSSSSRHLSEPKQPDRRGSSGLLRLSLIGSEKPETPSSVLTESLAPSEPESPVKQHCPTCQCYPASEAPRVQRLPRRQARSIERSYCSSIYRYNTPSQAIRARLNARYPKRFS